MLEKFDKNKSLYYSLFALALPIVFQNIITNSLNMIDTAMISRLGNSSVVAVSIAGRLQFIYTLIIYGFYSGGAVFVAQYNGLKAFDKIRTVISFKLILGLIAGISFTIFSLLFSKQYIQIFSQDEEVIRLGAQYLRYFSFSYIPFAISFAFVMSLRSMKDAKFTMFTSAISVITNTILNYLLIFGNFGFQKLGVEGAAIATTISRFIEVSLIIYSVYFGSRNKLRVSIFDIKNIEIDFIKKYIKIAWPIIASDAIWGFGTVMYSYVYSKFGTNIYASVQMCETINSVVLPASFGFASAVGTILGNKLGENKREEAIRDSRDIFRLSIVIGMMTGIILYLAIPLSALIFNAKGEVLLYMRRILIIRAITNIIITFNWANVIGILRSGGDTIYALIIDVVPMWFVCLPIALIGVLYFDLSIEWIIAVSFLEEFIKFIIGINRMLKNKWANVLVKE